MEIKTQDEVAGGDARSGARPDVLLAKDDAGIGFTVCGSNPDHLVGLAALRAFISVCEERIEMAQSLGAVKP